MVYAWNDLQDNLATIFWCVVGSTNGAIPLAIWNAIENDRAQRGMLRAALNVRAASMDSENIFRPTEDDRKNKKASRPYKDIKWLVDRLDELAGLRNNVIHAPLSFIISANGLMKMVPNDFQGHPRARDLTDYELIGEFRWYRVNILLA